MVEKNIAKHRPYDKYTIKTMPTLRDKKRYVVYEVISEAENIYDDLKQEIELMYKKLFGEIDFVEANLRFFPNISTKNKKVVQVERSHLEKLKVVMGWIKEVRGVKVIVRCVKVSGTIKTCKEFISSNA